MTYSHDLHAHLIGQPGSRALLNTPALILDRPALERNIARMAQFAQAHGLALRPHAKSHKSADIARLQIAAGAAGVCCAKLGEAEALAAEGIDGLHLTSPIVTPPAITRLMALARRMTSLSLVADHPAAVTALAAAAEASDVMITVLVDIDPGIRRTGVASAADAVALARQIAQSPALRYGGVQYYCGAQQHIASFAERQAAIAERTAYLSACLAELTAAGLAPPVVTGGGTGSHAIDAELGVLTELQVGSYVFMDREYGECDLTGGDAPFETALMIDARVISANARGLVTIDAGLKAFATDAGAPAVLSGGGADARYRFMGDEHGAILGDALPALGARVTLGAPHCDPTVNLYDAYHMVADDCLIAIWPVTARGRSA